MKPKNEEFLITSSQAAERLGYTASYIRRLCASGRIKAKKLGHNWVFSLAEIKDIKPKSEKDNLNGS